MSCGKGPKNALIYRESEKRQMSEIVQVRDGREECEYMTEAKWRKKGEDNKHSSDNLHVIEES